jgi:hypothetical protein
MVNAEELTGLASADQEVFEPFCELYTARSGVVALREAGYVSQWTVDNDSFVTKVIGFKKIGREPVPPEVTEDYKAFLYEIIEHIKVQAENEETFDAIVISEISTAECGMSMPLIILTSPEYKVLGIWESYFQSNVRRDDKGRKITPNLID